MKRDQSAGGRDIYQRGWVLKEKSAGQDDGEEEVPWAGAQRGEVPTECGRNGEALLGRGSGKSL